MDFWPEFLASSWGKEFVAGGFGGMAGIVSGYPLDTLRIRQQSMDSGSALSILRRVVAREGPGALYRGMAAPLASVTFQCIHMEPYHDPADEMSSNGSHFDFAFEFAGCSTVTFKMAKGSAYRKFCALQNAMVFQIYAILSRAFDSSRRSRNRGLAEHHACSGRTSKNPPAAAEHKFSRGFTITALRDAPSHGFYFWTYEYMREQLHPGCRKSGQETLRTMLMAGGLAGVASWVCCYPLDVVKTRLQAQSPASPQKYNGIIDCLQKSVKHEGYSVLWRGLGTAVARAFVVNGAIFSAYEIALRCLFTNGNIQTDNTM
ncbi:hypothetical protein V6N13_084051 [Hibiscus sabdariffa]